MRDACERSVVFKLLSMEMPSSEEISTCLIRRLFSSVDSYHTCLYESKPEHFRKESLLSDSGIPAKNEFRGMEPIKHKITFRPIRFSEKKNSPAVLLYMTIIPPKRGFHAMPRRPQGERRKKRNTPTYPPQVHNLRFPCCR